MRDAFGFLDKRLPPPNGGGFCFAGCLKAKPPLRPALAYKSGASGQIIGQIFLAKKKGGTMWQERKINSKNLQKFEDGLLRVDACFARLVKERGRFIEGLNSLTMAEASATIDELMACPV